MRGLFAVVLVVLVMVVVILPLYTDYTPRVMVSEGRDLAEGARDAVTDFYRNTHRFPVNNASAGIAPAASIAGNYVTSITVGVPRAGMVRARYGGPKADERVGRLMTLDLSPIASGDHLRWTCRSTTLPPKYLPTSCR